MLKTKFSATFISTFILYLFIFSLPFVYWQQNYFSPFETFKFVFSGFVVIGLLLIYIFSLIKNSTIEIRWSPTLTIFSCQLFSQVLSYVFSINPYLSFWGDYFLPADGFLSNLIFMALGFITTQLMTSLKQVEKIRNLLMYTAGLLSLHGILQHFGAATDTASAFPVASSAVSATIGHAVGYASVLGALIPLVLVRYFSLPFRRSLLGLPLVFLIFLALLYSGSRTPIVVSLGFTTLLILYFALKNLNLKTFLAAGMLASVIGLSIATYFAGDTKFLQNKLSSGHISQGAGVRLLVWKDGIKIWQQHPLLGSGIETFTIGQRALQNKDMYKLEDWDHYWSKAHNYLIQSLACTGICGLLCVLILIFFMALKCIQILKMKIFSETDFLVLGFSLGFLFLAVSNLTAFNFIPTQFFWFMFPIFACILGPTKIYNLKINPGAKAGLVAAALALAILFKSIYSFWQADILIHQSQYNTERTGDYLAAIALTDQAISLNDSNPSYYCHKAETLTSMLVKNKTKLSPKQIADVVGVIADTSGTCTELGINRHQFVLTRAMIFGTLFSEKLIPDITESEKGFHDLAKLNPNSPVPYYRLGLLYLFSERIPEFKEQMQKAINLKDDFIPAYKDLLIFYYRVNDQDSISKLIESLSKVTLYNVEQLSNLKGLSAIAETHHDEVSKKALTEIYIRNKALFE